MSGFIDLAKGFFSGAVLGSVANIIGGVVAVKWRDRCCKFVSKDLAVGCGITFTGAALMLKPAWDDDYYSKGIRCALVLSAIFWTSMAARQNEENLREDIRAVDLQLSLVCGAMGGSVASCLHPVIGLTAGVAIVTFCMTHNERHRKPVYDRLS